MGNHHMTTKAFLLHVKEHSSTVLKVLSVGITSSIDFDRPGRSWSLTVFHRIDGKQENFTVHQFSKTNSEFNAFQMLAELDVRLSQFTTLARCDLDL